MPEKGCSYRKLDTQSGSLPNCSSQISPLFQVFPNRYKKTKCRGWVCRSFSGCSCLIRRTGRWLLLHSNTSGNCPSAQRTSIPPHATSSCFVACHCAAHNKHFPSFNRFSDNSPDNSRFSKLSRLVDILITLLTEQKCSIDYQKHQGDKKTSCHRYVLNCWPSTARFFLSPRT